LILGRPEFLSGRPRSRRYKSIFNRLRDNPDPDLREALDAFRIAPDGQPLTEGAVLALSPPLLSERCNGMIEACRRSPNADSAQAVESFVVFFQTLVPTLRAEPAREVKATFFRLAPNLLQMAWEDFGGRSSRREEGQLELPDIPILSDIVVHIAEDESGEKRDLRLDRLGNVKLDLPPGLYRIGLAYEPEDDRGA